MRNVCFFFTARLKIGSRAHARTRYPAYHSLPWLFRAQACPILPSQSNGLQCPCNSSIHPPPPGLCLHLLISRGTFCFFLFFRWVDVVVGV